MAKKTKSKKSARPAAKKRKAGGTKKAQPKKVAGIGITPLADRVLVKPFTSEEAGTTSPSGIIIPDTVDKEKPEQGRVVAVGPGKFDDGTRVPMTVKVGDKVVFSKYGYDEVKVGGEEYYMLSENNILAIIE